MSEETNHELALQLIEMLKQKGKTEVKVSSLPTSIRSLILELGYDESATISVPKLEEYVLRAGGGSGNCLGTGTLNSQVPKSSQEFPRWFGNANSQNSHVPNGWESLKL